MKFNRPSPLALAACLVCSTAWSAPADAGVIVTTAGNRARADITLGGSPSNPRYTGTMFLSFDEAPGLNAHNLNITARVVDPADPALRARLPAGATIPGQFPVLVSVRPRNGFEFRNAADVELHTRNLAYSANSTYRLYKAPAGGSFHDLTEDVLAGSVRCRGRTGGFSDFLIVSDTAAAEDAATDKFAFLDARVKDEEIDSAASAQLQLDLDEAREEFLEGDYDDARAELADLDLHVEAGAGSSVPNRWRARGDLDNVAGSLEGEVASLDFYLRKLATAGSGRHEDDEGDSDD